ncbi:hypothetical protein IAT38_001704 [Cryptococcus sp. DSM 104549]
MIGNRIPSLDPKTAGIIGTGAEKRVVENRGMIGNRIASAGSGAYSPLMGQSTGGSTGSGGSGTVPKPSPAAAPAAAPAPRSTSPAGSVDSSVASATVDSTTSPITSRSSSPPSSPGGTAHLPSSLLAATLPALNANLGTSTPSSTRAEAGDTVSELSLSVPSTPMGNTPPLSAPEYDLVPPNLKLAAGGVPSHSGVLPNPMVRGLSQQSAGAQSLAGAFTPSISSSLATQSVGSEEETQMMADVSGVSTPMGTPRAARRELGEGSVVGEGSVAGEGSTAGDDVKDIESRLDGLEVADEAKPAAAAAAAGVAGAAAAPEDEAELDDGEKESTPPGGDVPVTPTVEKDEPLASSGAVAEPQDGLGTPTKEPAVIPDEPTGDAPAAEVAEIAADKVAETEEPEAEAPATPKSTASDPIQAALVSPTAAPPASTADGRSIAADTAAEAPTSATKVDDKADAPVAQSEVKDAAEEEVSVTEAITAASASGDVPAKKEGEDQLEKQEEEGEEEEEKEDDEGEGDDENNKTLRRVKAQNSLRAAEVFGAGAGLGGATLASTTDGKDQKPTEPNTVEKHVEPPAEPEVEMEVPAVDEAGAEKESEGEGKEIVVEHPAEKGTEEKDEEAGAAEAAAAVPVVSDAADDADAEKEEPVLAPETKVDQPAVVAVGPEVKPSEVAPSSEAEESAPKQLEVEPAPVAQPVVVAAETAPEDEVVQVDKKVGERKGEVAEAEAKSQEGKEPVQDESISATGAVVAEGDVAKVDAPAFPDPPTADPDVEDPIPADTIPSTPTTEAVPPAGLSPVTASTAAPAPAAGDIVPSTPIDGTMLKYFPEVPDEEKPRVEVHISSPAVTPQTKRRASAAGTPASPEAVSSLPGQSKSLSYDTLAQETPVKDLSNRGEEGAEKSSPADLEATPPGGSGKLGKRLSTRRSPKSPLLDDEDPGDFEPGEGWAVVTK